MEMNNSRFSKLFNQGVMLLLSRPSLLAAVIVTAIFSLRWSNCLPFSGFSPALVNVDTLGFMGRYFIFSQEEFHFPLGTIYGLSFPFESGQISRGAIPLFALIFKAAGRFYPPFLVFNYLVLAELMAVFSTAYFTSRMLSLFLINNFWIQLLGSCFVALSPALLFRSSVYYGETFVVLNFPLILMTAYFCIQLFMSPEKWKFRLAFMLIFPVIALVDLYLLFATFILVGTAGLVMAWYVFSKKHSYTAKRFKVFLITWILGSLLSLSSLWLLGNQNNLETPSRSTLFNNRDGTVWGYGGGFGGGFHVADVFSVLTANPTLLSESHLNPPKSLIDRLDVPILNQRLQPGQYEGFSFIGSLPLLLLMFSTGIWLWRNSQKSPSQQVGKRCWKKMICEYLLNPFNLSVSAIALGCICLYFFSWGYILHIFGHRLNNILTPSALLAFIYPKFMYARSLGRLAIPFSMLLSFVSLLFFYRNCLISWVFDQSKSSILPWLVTLLILLHLVDVADYLKSPEKVFYGNEIARTFSDEDIQILKNTTGSSVAVMLVPELLSSLLWNKIGFSIAYHTRIPISGSTLGFGEKQSELRRYTEDVNSISNGEIQKILSAYGSVVIAAPHFEAEKIVSKSDVPLTSIKLKSQDVVLLLPQGHMP